MWFVAVHSNIWQGLGINHAGTRVGSKVEDQTDGRIGQDSSGIVHGTVHGNAIIGMGGSQIGIRDGGRGFDFAGGVIGRGVEAYGRP